MTRYARSIMRCDVVVLDLSKAILADRVRAKSLPIGFHHEDAIAILLWGDAIRLRQILVNLVGNAITFTEAGGIRVQVQTQEVRAEEVVLHVDVQDTGVGIPPDLPLRTFDAFRQTEGSTARGFGGTGLGLAISKPLSKNNLIGEILGTASGVVTK